MSHGSTDVVSLLVALDVRPSGGDVGIDFALTDRESRGTRDSTRGGRGRVASVTS